MIQIRVVLLSPTTCSIINPKVHLSGDTMYIVACSNMHLQMKIKQLVKTVYARCIVQYIGPGENKTRFFSECMLK